MMIRRLAVALAVGSAMTFGLLFVMQGLIATSRGALTERHAAVRVTNFVRARKRQVTQTRRQKPHKPSDAQQQPKIRTAAIHETGGGVPVSIFRPKIAAVADARGIDIAVANGDYLPIIKVAPVYPPRAAADGLEGYVVVAYTVTETGTTRNVHVIESTNSVFDRAAIASARKYKYKPRVVNDEPVEVPGVETKITFVLEK